MSDYQSITIKEALDKIYSNKLLLPGIQREFVWDMDRIENLFDSVLRGYPINSFMFWKVTDRNICKEYVFYEFLRTYTERFGCKNQRAQPVALNNDFEAVIDGQQRLNSLYIGLTSSYKVKKKHKRWGKNEDTTAMVERKLYLEITEALPLSVDSQKAFNLRFLSEEELQKDRNENPTHFWFLLKNALSWTDLGEVMNFVKDNHLENNGYAFKTLSLLFQRIRLDKTINYYSIDEQEQDRVLEIFIRTNSGGVSLSFSDLLMSISSANWQNIDAREEIDSAIKAIGAFGNPSFNVSKDFVLKSILVLCDGDLKFKLENFGRTSVENYERQWPMIKKALIATFQFLGQLNFNDCILKSKNAAIPLAYYIYKHELADSIVKTTYDKEEKRKIARWMNMTLLKEVFGRSSDSALSSMRSIIKGSQETSFPADEIGNRFRYSFSEDDLDELLRSQYATPDAGLVLNLLYPNVAIEHGNNVAQDHMHPKSAFTSKGKLDSLNLTEDDRKFFEDPSNYNSCLNLQLLESIENESKRETELSKWARGKNKNRQDLFVGEETSLELKDFKSFIASRNNHLKVKLREILGIRQEKRGGETPNGSER